MIIVKPFKAEHALSIVTDTTEDFAKAMKFHELGETALTVFWDNQIMVCGGVHVLAPRVGEIWTVPSPLVKKHYIAYHRFMLKWRDIFMKKYNLVRMQATVDVMNETAVKWIEALGFEREGRLRKCYGYGDFYLYSRVI